jgi:hypothetical protein
MNYAQWTDIMAFLFGLIFSTMSESDCLCPQCHPSFGTARYNVRPYYLCLQEVTQKINAELLLQYFMARSLFLHFHSQCFVSLQDNLKKRDKLSKIVVQSVKKYVKTVMKVKTCHRERCC